MPLTKLKTDCHSLYFKANGAIYRPVKSVDSYEIDPAHHSREDGTSAFPDGLVVMVLERAQTPFATVRVADFQECWHSHGRYFHKTVEQCWTPAPPEQDVIES